VDWAEERDLGLDFNATCFSHPKAADGFTLSHRDGAIREFWVDHVKRCREIGAYMGRKLETPCMHNLWLPDGSKDHTVSRFRHRELLKESLERIYADEIPREHLIDSLESKLFGIGSESYVVGSHEFYLGWCARHGHVPCLDMGHFHPTESVADKLSALLQFYDELLLHVSRPVRWDSDHVVTQDDDLRFLMEEIVRGDMLDQVYLALDFFDAGINRVGAWVVGTRAALKALLLALLEPTALLRNCERRRGGFERLALLEQFKTLPFGAVWEMYCEQQDVPVGPAWIEQVMLYEEKVLVRR